MTRPIKAPTHKTEAQLIKKTHNHFIHTSGYVFKIEQGKEKEIVGRKMKNGSVEVTINEKKYDLLLLMLEYFFPDYNPNDSLKFKADRLNRICYSSIRIVKVTANACVSSEDDKIMLDYGCKVRATSSNQRGAGIISGIQILECLKINDFRCVYCNCQLFNHNFHLDHFVPISGGGKNEFKNLVSSCKRCNMMKGSLDGNAFVYWCYKVVLKNNLNNSGASTHIGKEKIRMLNAALKRIISGAERFEQ